MTALVYRGPVYRNVLVVAAQRWDAQPREIRAAMTEADLVVCNNGLVIKDRYGRAPRSDSKLAAYAFERVGMECPVLA